MAADGFACPECGCILKTAQPVPAGRKVQCPRCWAIFVATDGDAATGIRAEPPLARPVGVPGPAISPGYPPAPRSDDDLDLRDYRDGPRRIHKPASGARVLMMILLILVLVAGAGVAGYFWLRANRHQDGPGLQPEIAALLPADAVAIMGFDLEAARRLNGFEQGLQQGLNNLPIPAGFKSLAQNANQVVMAFSGRDANQIVVIIHTRTPYDPVQMRTTLGVGAGREVQGKTIHSWGDQLFGQALVAMPSTRTIVVGVMPEDDFAGVLQNEGKPSRVPADVNQSVVKMGRPVFWAVVPLTGEVKTQVGKLDQDLGPMAAVLPQLPKIMPVVRQSRNVAFWMDPGPNNTSLRVSMAVNCANEADAASLARDTRDLWNEKLKAMIAAFGPMLDNMAAANGGPAVSGLLKDLDSLTFETRGNVTVAFATFHEQSVKGMGRMGNNPFLDIMGHKNQPLPPVVEDPVDRIQGIVDDLVPPDPQQPAPNPPEKKRSR